MKHTSLNQHRDADQPESEEGKMQMPLITEENLSAMIDDLEVMRQQIQHNEPLTQALIDRLRQNANQLVINLHGREITLAEIEQDPQLSANVKIWNEISKGNFDNYTKLTLLTGKIADLLSQKDGQFLSLNKLTTIPDEQLRALVQSKAEDLDLDGLTSLTDTQAQLLGQFMGRSLSLDGVTSLTEAQAQSLARFRGQTLTIKSVQSLSDTQVQALGAFSGNYIDLRSLGSLSDAGCEALGNIPQLYPGGVTSLTVAQAERLFKRSWCYRTIGITSLTDELAKKLASFDANCIDLPALTSISDQQAEFLTTFRGGELDLGITSLTDAQARAFARFAGGELQLVHLGILTDTQAKALVPIRMKLGWSQSKHEQMERAASSL